MTATSRKTALVTGASSGIGRALAHEFARAGHNVVVTSRRAEHLEALCLELQRQHGVSARTIAADLASPDGPQHVWRSVDAAHEEIDYLVNDAGLGHVGPFATTPRAGQLEMMDVNMRALVELTHLFLPGMLARRQGAVLNIGSTSAFLPGPGMAVYFASKAFVVSFTQALAYELRGTGVSATVVCPGPTDTAFPRLAGSDRLALYRNGKLATAADVAAHAYRSMMQGESISLHGKRTALRAGLLKLAPVSLATWFGARATRPTP